MKKIPEILEKMLAFPIFLCYNHKTRMKSVNY